LLQSLGISLRSATEPIDDTSTGKLMEGVLAAFAQFDNDCRSDRTRACMKAAGARPLGVSGADRLLERAARDGQKPDTRPATRADRAPRIRRVRHLAFSQAASARAGTNLGLDHRRGGPLTSQAIGVLLRNQLYAGIVDVTEYGVRGKRGDFEPLISEDLFFPRAGGLIWATPEHHATAAGAPGRALWRTTFACIHERRLVDLTSASWNQITPWLRRLDALRLAA
jgi:hypothetical protein